MTLFSRSTPATQVLQLLNVSLLLNVVGFGACIASVSNDYRFIIIPSLVYLVAGWLALRCLLHAHKSFDKTWKRIGSIIAALVLGGWGFYWGVFGIMYAF